MFSILPSENRLQHDRGAVSAELILARSTWIMKATIFSVWSTKAEWQQQRLRACFFVAHYTFGTAAARQDGIAIYGRCGLRPRSSASCRPLRPRAGQNTSPCRTTTKSAGEACVPGICRTCLPRGRSPQISDFCARYYCAYMPSRAPQRCSSACRESADARQLLWFTDRLEEFAVVLGYLLGLGNILNVGRIRTGDLPNPGN